MSGDGADERDSLVMIMGELARYCRTSGRCLGYGMLLLFCWSSAWVGAVGLGEAQLQSNIGQVLRARVPLLGGQTNDILPGCVKARLQTIEGTFVAALNVSMSDAATITLSSPASVQEPVVTLVLDVNCGAHISRHYQLLLDPPENLLPQIKNTASAQQLEVKPTALEPPPGKALARTRPATPRVSADTRVREREVSNTHNKAPNKARNVLKLDASTSGPLLPLPDGAALQLVLSRRLRNDASPVASVAQEVFADKVRQQQNQAVLTELERAEMKFMQQKIQALAVEINRIRQAQALPQGPSQVQVPPQAPTVPPVLARSQPQAQPQSPTVRQPEPKPLLTPQAQAQTDPVSLKQPLSAKLAEQAPTEGQDRAIILGCSAVLVLLGLWFLYKKRKEKHYQEIPANSMFPEAHLPPNSVLDTAGGKSIDTNSSVFNSNFMPSASQLDINEVDPVAEAGVYIAYGRDIQAEEILKDAIRTDPHRHAARVKLLEIYAARKDTRSFEVQASELYSMTQGVGEDWEFAASIGLSIDPDNPLYGDKHSAVAESPVVSVVQPDVPGDPWHNTGMLVDLDANVMDQVVENDLILADDGEYETDFDLGKLSFEPENLPVFETAAQIALPGEPEPEPSPDFVKALVLPEFDFEFPNLPQEDAEMIVASLPMEDDGLDLLMAEFPETESSVDEPVTEFALEPFTECVLDPVAEAVLAPSPVADVIATEVLLESPLEDKLTPEDENDPFSSLIEMATRIDLAVAYQEIGYKEGARELIDEVIKGGTPEQIERAKAMRAMLA